MIHILTEDEREKLKKVNFIFSAEHIIEIIDNCSDDEKKLLLEMKESWLKQAREANYDFDAISLYNKFSYAIKKIRGVPSQSKYHSIEEIKKSEEKIKEKIRKCEEIKKFKRIELTKWNNAYPTRLTEARNTIILGIVILLVGILSHGTKLSFLSLPIDLAGIFLTYYGFISIDRASITPKDLIDNNLPCDELQ